MPKRKQIQPQIISKIKRLSASGLEPRLIAAMLRLPVPVVLVYSVQVPEPHSGQIRYPEREQLKALIRDGFSDGQIARMTGRSNAAIADIRNSIAQELQPSRQTW